VILDAAPADSTLTLGFDSEDCDADYRTLTGLARKPSRLHRIALGAPAPPAYLKGPGALTIEIEQVLKRA